jgi:hypothetical protein
MERNQQTINVNVPKAKMTIACPSIPLKEYRKEKNSPTQPIHNFMVETSVPLHDNETKWQRPGFDLVRMQKVIK